MEITTKMVSIPGGTPNLGGYAVMPEGAGPWPGLVVIHEAFGLNDDIKSIAERFAKEGYAVLAVDLFAGRNQMVCMFRFMGASIFNSLNHGGIADLKVALSFWETQAGVDKNKLGAIGFCLGGNFAICWACTDSRLKVVAPFYGAAPRPLGALARSCPVVGSYPTGDFTTQGAHEMDAALDGYKIPHEFKFYEGAHHSFFSNGRNHHEEAAQDAWKRTLAFFKGQIG